MQWHQLSKIEAQRTAKRIGRGGKRGTFSGRGVKGQKARAGRKLRPEWRDALKSIPKKRGYNFKSIKERPAILNLRDLDKVFRDGDPVNINVLAQKGLVLKARGRLPQVKILGQGNIKKKLNFKGLVASAGAKEAILKAGGTFN